MSLKKLVKAAKAKFFKKEGTGAPGDRRGQATPAPSPSTTPPTEQQVKILALTPADDPVANALAAGSGSNTIEQPDAPRLRQATQPPEAATKAVGPPGATGPSEAVGQQPLPSTAAFQQSTEVAEPNADGNATSAAASEPPKVKADSAGEQASPASEPATPRNLWEVARDNLDQKDQNMLAELKTQKLAQGGDATAGSSAIVESIIADANEMKDEANESSWKPFLDKIVDGAIRFKALGDAAVKFDTSGYAALGWSVVSFGLEIAKNETTLREAVFSDIKTIPGVIARYVQYEYLYRDLVSEDKEFEDLIVEVYKALFLYTIVLNSYLKQSKPGRYVHAFFPVGDRTITSKKDAIDKADREVKRWLPIVKEKCDQGRFENLRQQIERLTQPVYFSEEQRERIKGFFARSDRNEVLDWLPDLDTQSKTHVDIQNKASIIQDPGQWIIGNDEFEEWQNLQVSSGIWVRGGPGTGKTVLTSTVINHFTHLYKDTVQGAMAFYYCCGSTVAKPRTAEILQSILRQLLATKRGFEEFKAWKDEHEKRELKNDVMMNLIKKMVELNASQTTTIIIDALDKVDKDTCRQVINFLKNLISETPGLVKVFVSSTEEHHIEVFLKSWLYIEVHPGLTKSDIDNYIDNYVAHSLHLCEEEKAVEGKLREDLRELLKGQANGRFRYIELAILQICQFSEASQIRREMTDLPNDLSGIQTEPERTNRARLPCHLIPFPKNLRFVGREKTIHELQRKLFIQKDCQKAAIVGLGGVGKTQVALQLAYWAKKHRPECSIFWVPALSRASFEQAYAEMARKLPIQKSSEDEEPKEAVRRFLNSEAAGPWLFVVDNADDVDILFGSSDIPGVSEYLPENEAGLILFTTRSRDVAMSVAESDVIELHEMDPPEAASFLEKLLIRKDLLRDKAGTELLKELTYLPLAITQAAAYLNRNQISIAKYLELLRGTERDTVSLMSREFRDSTRYKGSQNAVATTWLVSFDQIRKSDSAAADLLSFISCIEPKAIPRSILPRLESEEQMAYTIGTLLGYAFVAERGDNQVFDMHSLVHFATRLWVRREGLAVKTTEKVIRHLAAAFPTNDYTNRGLWREYMPHALRVLFGDEGVEMEERYHLSFRVGRCLQEDGRIKEAVRWLEECYRWRKSRFPDKHPDRLGSQHTLAMVYIANGQAKDAVALLEQVVAIRQRDLAEDHFDRLESQHALAMAYQVNGQVKEAIALLEQVATIQASTPAEDYPDQIAVQHALALAYRDNGQVKEAVELLEQVVAIQASTLAEDHPRRLAAQHALAIAYDTNGQVKEAVALLEQVVAIRKRDLTEGHPDRLAAQHSLAVAYRANGQVKEAVELLEQVVAIQASTLAEDHPHRLAAQYALAIAYGINGQFKEAVALLEQVVAIRKRDLTEDHPDRLAAQQALAVAYQANGQVKEAVVLLEQVVAIEAKTLAENHPDRLAAQQALVTAYSGDNRFKEAATLLEQVAAIQARTLADDHPLRLASEQYLSLLLEIAGAS